MESKSTSIDAWWSWQGVQSDTLDHKILTTLNKSPEGLMCWQIERSLNRSHQSVSGNLRHLVERGLVQDSGEKGYTESRRRAVIWKSIQPQSTQQGEHMSTAVENKKDLPLQLKYRPTTFDEVIGHKNVIQSLKTQLKATSQPHCYLFLGPSGTGKTTLAKIMAKELGCDPRDIVEVDCAADSSVDNIRRLTENMTYMPLFGKIKVAIVDECHTLSKQAWQALLKPTEDAPSHVYYIFCTTEEAKFPDTMKTRITTYTLKALSRADLETYGSLICEVEDIKLPEGSMTLIADAASGSPRSLLVNLSKVRGAESLDDIRAVMATASIFEEAGVVDLARLLVQGSESVPKYTDVLNRIENFSGAKSVLKAYVGSVALGQIGNRNMTVLMEMIDRLPPFPSEKDGKFDLILLVNRYLCTLATQRK